MRRKILYLIRNELHNLSKSETKIIHGLNYKCKDLMNLN